MPEVVAEVVACLRTLRNNPVQNNAESQENDRANARAEGPGPNQETHTAGVERVFSASGKMHGVLSKSVSADTIEHSLFAAINAP